MKPAAILCAVAVLAGSAPSQASGATPGPDSYRCQVMAFSPAVATDGTGLCVTLDFHTGTMNPDGNASAYLTTDGGRTWQKRRSDGLRPVLSPMLRQVVFSPAYGSDRAIYLQAYGRGLLRTTDGGDTWLPVSPATETANAYRALTPVTPAALPASVTTATFAFAATPPARVSPPLHVPVAGAPGSELQFLSSGATTLVASLDADAVTRLYACDVSFACVTRFHEFPAGHEWVDGWLPPDFATTGRAYATTWDRERRTYAWRSLDGGRTFTRWRSLDAYLRPIVNTNGTTVMLAARPGSRTMYARISHRPFPRNGPLQPSPPAPPAEQVLRSDDAGATWRRVAYSLSHAQEGARGTLPFNAPVSTDRSVWSFELLPDGRLVTVAADFPRYFGVFTSPDGRTWSRPRFS